MQTLLIRSVIEETLDIRSFELVHPEGHELPRFTPGAHVDIKIPGGMLRQYSLCNDPREDFRYVIAILRVRNGRGGSAAMHSRIKAGDWIDVSNPRNHFSLNLAADHHLLIAGGIGVTPILSMIEELIHLRAKFEVHYCTRSQEQTPFLQRLQPLIDARTVICHHDGGDPTKGLDVQKLLKDRKPGMDVYCCGPSSLMKAVATAAAHWPSDAVHFEHFTVPLASARGPDLEVEFVIKLARSGVVLAVPKGKSIVQVLREFGIQPETSCEAGLCGSCRTRYLEGVPDHRDFVLSPEEQTEFLMPCCARAKSPMLVLDV